MKSGSMVVVCAALTLGTGCIPKQPAPSATGVGAPAEEKRDSKDFMKMPYNISTLHHPALTDAVEPNINEFDWGYMSGMPPDGSLAAASIVELTHDRLCIDTIYSRDKSTGLALDYHPFWLSTEGRRFRKPHALEHASLEVLKEETRAVPAMGTQFSYRDTGRTETKCVEALTNHRGTVVSCARYESGAVLDEVRTPVAQTRTIKRYTARVCWNHAGLIKPSTKWISIGHTSEDTFGTGSPDFSFAFAGDPPAKATWGGKGGTSLASAPWEVSTKDWGLTTCQMYESRPMRAAQPGPIDVTGSYQCVFHATFAGTHAEGKLVQGPDGRVRGSFFEFPIGSKEREDAVRWEGVVAGDYVDLKYPGLIAGVRLKIEAGGTALNGKGAILIARTKQCAPYGLTCKRVGPASASDVPESPRPATASGGTAPARPGPPTRDPHKRPTGSPPPSSTPPSTSPAGPANDEIVNRSTKPVCTVDVWDRKSVHQPKNLLGGKTLAPNATAKLQVPANAAILRVVSCDRKWIGMSGYDSTKRTSYPIVDGAARKHPEIGIMAASTFAGSPFAK